MRCRRASASSSRPRTAWHRVFRERAVGSLSGVLAALVLAAPVAEGKVFHTRQEALELAFPDADRIDKETIILSRDQVAAIEVAARAKVQTKLVTIFTAWKGGEVQGYAHIDVHTVRTHPSALLVVWGPDGKVRTVRILAFHEPLDYLPADKWYAQFEGADADDKLRVGGDIHGVVNATLSTQVAADSVRRALAYHAVLILPRHDGERSEASQSEPSGTDAARAARAEREEP